MSRRGEGRKYRCPLLSIRDQQNPPALKHVPEQRRFSILSSMYGQELMNLWYTAARTIWHTRGTSNSSYAGIPATY